eukprot:COSAG01_NODE_5640_length_4123_cov_2.033052_3_plen_201_part_00
MYEYWSIHRTSQFSVGTAVVGRTIKVLSRPCGRPDSWTDVPDTQYAYGTDTCQAVEYELTGHWMAWAYCTCCLLCSQHRPTVRAFKTVYSCTRTVQLAVRERMCDDRQRLAVPVLGALCALVRCTLCVCVWNGRHHVLAGARPNRSSGSAGRGGAERATTRTCETPLRQQGRVTATVDHRRHHRRRRRRRRNRHPPQRAG